MGDYTKIIVNCHISGKINKSRDELFQEFSSITGGLWSSSYHAKMECFEFNEENNGLLILTQSKYGRDTDAIIDWLAPMVVKGVGGDECFLIEFSEYSPRPKLFSIHGRGSI